jgi:hypothetical protein
LKKERYKNVTEKRREIVVYSKEESYIVERE